MWRGLLWLIALSAFVCPPAIAAAATSGSAMPLAEHHCANCPPPPCPENDTTRHTGAPCCPLMAQAMAVLSPSVVVECSSSAVAFPVSAGPDLTGLSPHQDPPPPRV